MIHLYYLKLYYLPYQYWQLTYITCQIIITLLHLFPQLLIHIQLSSSFSLIDVWLTLILTLFFSFSLINIWLTLNHNSTIPLVSSILSIIYITLYLYINSINYWLILTTIYLTMIIPSFSPDQCLIYTTCRIYWTILLVLPQSLTHIP